MNCDAAAPHGSRTAASVAGWPAMTQDSTPEEEEDAEAMTKSLPLFARALLWAVTLSVGLLGAQWGSEVGTVRQSQASPMHALPQHGQQMQEAVRNANLTDLTATASTDESDEDDSQRADIASDKPFDGDYPQPLHDTPVNLDTSMVARFPVNTAESNGITAALTSPVDNYDNTARPTLDEDGCGDACWRLLWASEPATTSDFPAADGGSSGEPQFPSRAIATMVPGENDAVLRLVQWDRFEEARSDSTPQRFWQASRPPLTETVGASAVRVATKTKAWLLQWLPVRTDSAGWRLSWANGMDDSQNQDCKEASCGVLRMPFLQSFSYPSSSAALLPVTSSSSSFQMQTIPTGGGISSRMR